MRIFRYFLLSLCVSLLSPLSVFADTPAPVNINTADASVLTSLNGIGQTKAEAIVAYRTANGPFKAVDELVAVQGIGESILSKNRDRIVINNEKVAPK